MDKPQTVNIQVVGEKHLYINWTAPATSVPDFYEVERQVFGSDSWKILESGLWVTSGTADQITILSYLDRDVSSINIYQYRVRAYKDPDYSDYSYSCATGVGLEQKVGYTFKNYVVPTNQWGVAGTADDIRYTYLFGIDLIAQNRQEFTNKQLEFYIDSAVNDFETWLGIVIKRRRILTQPLSGKVRVRDWTTDCDYTHEDDPYQFDPDVWRDGYGQLKLIFFPVINLIRAELYTETDALLLDLIKNEWIRLDKHSGIVSQFPKVGVEALGPFTQGSAYMRTLYGRAYPHGFKFDYDAGYETSDFIPEGLREVILMWATVKALDSIGDGLLAGFSSSSISLDGLSESFSSTQSATSAFFGARIKSYLDHMKEWGKKHRYSFYNVPLGFV